MTETEVPEVKQIRPWTNKTLALIFLIPDGDILRNSELPIPINEHTCTGTYTQYMSMHYQILYIQIYTRGESKTDNRKFIWNELLERRLGIC